MTLQDALTRLIDETYSRIGELYVWEFDQERLPVALVLHGKNGFEHNLSLRHQLNALWISADQPLRERIAYFYIAVWGRVRGNRPQKILDYTQQPAAALVTRGAKGVASWSKLLSVMDPARYAIYDARVAAALNCLQLLHCENVALFPLLPSQNRRVIAANAALKRHARFNGHKVAGATFYTEYLQLLRYAAEHSIHSIDIQTVEMLLFALAEALIEQSLFLRQQTKQNAPRQRPVPSLTF